jgi:hypothetical protein
MSNLYGYTDYHGPPVEGNETADDGSKVENEPQNYSVDDDEDDDPLRCGMWMEGDSLAPPCGSSVPLIHSIISFAAVVSEDVLYDFGCGDGRVCLEALVKRDCRHCVGIEIEEDLVQKAQMMISNLRKTFQEKQEGTPRIQVLQADLRECIQALVARGNNERAGKGPFQDLPMPTIIIIYLLPEAIAELEENFIALLRYARIVCNTWGLPSLKESSTIEIREEGGASTRLFLYEKRLSSEK